MNIVTWEIFDSNLTKKYDDQIFLQDFTTVTYVEWKPGLGFSQSLAPNVKAEQEVVHWDSLETHVDFQNKTNRVKTRSYLAWLQQQPNITRGVRPGISRFEV